MITGLYGDTLRYAAIRIQLVFDAQDIDYRVGREYRDRWTALVDVIAETSAHPLKSVFHVTDGTWAWVQAQQVHL